MSTTLSTSLAAQPVAYVGLQREMHDALRAQHPEWITPDGESPICDSYEERLAQLLSHALEFERSRASSERASRRPLREELQSRTAPRQRAATMLAGYAEERNMVFHQSAAARDGF
ncbi:MAG TPA: hypothetical protein VH207_05005 [Chthoniobacterales bacterium]|jgi:hypothetical protein|nr:hypothetical protein [Chthoniobacterales bacterium]